MSDLDQAMSILKNEALSCVFKKGDKVFKSSLSGIKPLLLLIESGENLSGFSAADKIVGKAAALLFVYAGVAKVFGGAVSKAALQVLKANGIPCEYDVLSEYIASRDGKGTCPMEILVREIESPQEAYMALKSKLNL